MSSLKKPDKLFQRKGKKLPVNASVILRDIIEESAIDERKLRETALKYSKLYVEGKPKLNEMESHARIFDYSRDMRIFLIRKVISYLYKNEFPSSLIECGSAGDISAALALPNTRITAVDIDPDIYINEINEIPQKLFDILGMDRIFACYGDAWRKKFYERNKKIVNKCLPNYERVIADGENLEYGGETYDFALVQGTPDLINICRNELGRVLKPGGYLASIVTDLAHPADSPSFYTTGTYVSWPKYKITNPKKERLPFKTIEIPANLKDLETLCSWNSSDEKLSTGFVFEIYRKK